MKLIGIRLSAFCLLMVLSPFAFAIIPGEKVCFKEDDFSCYQIYQSYRALNNAEESDWIEASPVNNPENRVYFGRRIVLQVSNKNIINSISLKVIKDFGYNIYILEAQDASTAIYEAQRIAQLNGVLSCHPIMKKRLIRHWSYSPQPNDSYYLQQWNLQNRSNEGASVGVDINARSAWSVSTGDGVSIAISDGGIDLDHNELYPRALNMPHYNFVTLQTNGMPSSIYETHGTHIAGIIAAEMNNHRGMAGIAPQSRFASWVIFDSGGYPVSNQRLADMFQYCSNTIAVQTHCWGFNGVYLESPSVLEQVSISNALKYGRTGKGVVVVRSVGNERKNGGNANYNGYVNNPEIIAVGSVRSNGKVASYSNPGTTILVSAPGGDIEFGYPGIFTTDIHGDGGESAGTNDLADYIYGENGFSGTSASAPQVAGIASLTLSVNSNLTYRDVQQILLLSARQYDYTDAFLQTNGAGLRVSFNTGFGVPDAGLAVRLASMWSNRPTATTISLSITNTVQIPENGLRVKVSGYNVPPELTSIAALPNGLGPRADKPTAALPLVYIENPLQSITTNLERKAALMPSIGSFFEEMIINAANAGATFAIIYNSNSDKPDERFVMNVSDSLPIPGAFISYRDGAALRTFISGEPTAVAQLQLTAATMLFNVTNTMLCEHIGLTLRTDHGRRGELRIAIQSPSETVSVLQRTNYDYTAIPSGWVYYSTHHFYEKSEGVWKLFVSDEVTNNVGNILSATLFITGVQISDTNHNGIDDNYEQHYKMVNANMLDDPDKDGWQNSIEQILNTDPLVPEPITIDISKFNSDFLRLSWDGSASNQYHALFSTNLNSWSELTNILGNFPETLFFVPATNGDKGFFKIKQISE